MTGHDVNSIELPPGFPTELITEAFIHLSEAAWRPPLALEAVEWLGAHGFALLGTEIWRPKRDGIHSLPYFQCVNREDGEDWNSFVTRAAVETIAYLQAFKEKFAEEGDVYINLTWVSQRNFQDLKAT